MMTLREQYNRDGYAIYKNSLSVDLSINSINGDKEYIWGEICRKFGIDYNMGTPCKFREIFKHDVSLYISVASLISKMVDVQKIFFHDDIMKSLHQLGIRFPIAVSQPVYHVMDDTCVIPNGYNGTSAHQDWSSVQGGCGMITVWIPLRDIKKNQFPIEVIPGSHKRGFIDGKINGSVLEIECDEKDFVPLECEKGDIIFLSGFIIHRTGGDRWRREAISQRFDDAGDPMFMERKYPCAQKRIVDREIKWKPTVEQVRKIYAVD